jgi:hypothetical protein
VSVSTQKSTGRQEQFEKKGNVEKKKMEFASLWIPDRSSSCGAGGKKVVVGLMQQSDRGGGKIGLNEYMHVTFSDIIHRKASRTKVPL